MTIDSHQHFWRYDADAYDWIDSSMEVLRRDHLPAEFVQVMAENDVDGSVAVQARETIDETRWLLALAAQEPRIKAVVGWVPLRSPEIAAVLAEFAGEPRLKGVRHVVQNEPDPLFLERPDFNVGIREVAAAGLTYDLLIKAHQLRSAIAFADRHPDVTLVLDHIAKPVISGAPPAEWRREIGELARRSNVYCKFSGVVTEVVGRSWSAELLRPYFNVVLEAFGPSRLMFGSDWPVCRLRAAYRDWISFVRSCARALSAGEQAAIFGTTATRAYRIS